MFKERLRDVVADTIPRVQAQVHMYEIIKLDNDPDERRSLERDLVNLSLSVESVSVLSSVLLSLDLSACLSLSRNVWMKCRK